MAAAIHDIELEEHSNLNFEYTYLDENDNPVNVSNYGALVAFAKDEDSKAIIQGTNVDGWIQVGSSDGKIILAVPYTAYQNLTVKEGHWQLYIYPTSGDVTDRPKRLVEGSWIYSGTIIDNAKL